MASLPQGDNDDDNTADDGDDNSDDEGNDDQFDGETA
jgi:hypothetical protein